jgi:acyl-CoA thioesterase FadM
MAFYSYPRNPTFAESDAAGVIHFSNIARYVEEAEHAFLAEAGCPVDLLEADALHWPRVQFSAEFKGVMRPFQAIRVELEAEKVGGSSIAWGWVIRSEEGECLAQGQMKTVCCRKEGDKLASAPLPESVRARLEKGL